MNSMALVPPHPGRPRTILDMARLPSRTRASRLAAAAVALSLGVAACGGSDADDAAGGSDAEAAASGPVLDASVFSGEATTVDGASFDLGPLANQDLVVWFWAPW